MKKIIYLLTAILFYNAASAQVKVQVQKPITTNKPVFDKNYKVLSVTDVDWEQKETLSIKPNPFKCELWITTDGTLHCKTDAALAKTDVFYLMPNITSAKDEKGNSTGVGGGHGSIMNFKKAAGSDEYTWGITEKKYNTVHTITLTAFNERGQKGIFTLENKKVAADIQK